MRPLYAKPVKLKKLNIQEIFNKQKTIMLHMLKKYEIKNMRYILFILTILNISLLHTSALSTEDTFFPSLIGKFEQPSPDDKNSSLFVRPNEYEQFPRHNKVSMAPSHLTPETIYSSLLSQPLCTLSTKDLQCQKEKKWHFSYTPHDRNFTNHKNGLQQTIKTNKVSIQHVIFFKKDIVFP